MTDAAEKFWALRFAKRPDMRNRSMLLRMSCPASRATTSSVWEANDFEANDDKLDNESDCRVAHARQSCAIAPPSHAGVKAR